MKNLLKYTTTAIITLLLSVGVMEMQAKAKENNKIKVALLLDTSNSMDGLINQAKSQLWKIVNELNKTTRNGKKPDIEIALYEYGNDNLSAYSGYIRQLSGFTSELDKISEDLFSLSTRGGSEFCGAVIKKSLDDLNWGGNSTDLKLIFIAGNEPFTQGDVSYKDACKNAFKKGIVVNTIHCGSYRDGINGKWKDGADITDGKYMIINHNDATVYIKSPYDDRIAELNKKLNATYFGFGREGTKKKMRQSKQDYNANKIDKANMVLRAQTKVSKAYSNSSWDIVDAYKENTVKLEEMEESQLPKEMKGMEAKERKLFVENKLKERQNIQKEIKVLVAKREKYVAEQTKKTNNEKSLDNAILEAVKKQAVKKNYFIKK